MPLKQLAETLEVAYRQDDRGEGRKRPTRSSVRRLRQLFFQVLFPEVYCEEGLRGRLRERTHRRLAFLKARLVRTLRRLPQQTKDKEALVGLTHRILLKLPEIRELLLTDVEAALTNDPAAKDKDEVLLSYPFVEAMTTHRVAHVMYLEGIAILPRMLSELAHRDTGIDIHPGATIGKYFFIDHGTGVVIGETAQIGERVTLYQGVTLGAKNPKNSEQNDQRGKKRHPTLEAGVTVYAGATILGGDTVIGENGVVGGNVWLTQSLPPGAKVLAATPENRIIKVGESKVL